jgi:hypothetical protein
MEHISDESLRYYLGMINDEAELAPLEEHLLWCRECLDRAETAARFVDRIRVGLKHSLRRARPAPRRKHAKTARDGVSL